MAHADTVTLPYDWAAYLVNGDASALSDEDLAAADAALARIEGHVVSMVDGTDRFTWAFKTYGGTAQGGDVADYVVLN